MASHLPSVRHDGVGADDDLVHARHDGKHRGVVDHRRLHACLRQTHRKLLSLETQHSGLVLKKQFKSNIFMYHSLLLALTDVINNLIG